MRNPWGPKVAPRAAAAVGEAVRQAPSVELRFRKRRGQPVAYLPHEGNRARARRMAQLERQGRGWFCVACKVVHGFDVPVVFDAKGRRCEAGK